MRRGPRALAVVPVRPRAPILSEADWRRRCTSRATSSTTRGREAWAIGWYAVRREDVIWRMHSGGHYGFITNACFDPEEKVGAIALLNGFGPATSSRWSSARSRARP